MLRHLFRLTLFILVLIGRVLRKHPGASVGFLIGSTIGFVMGICMVKFGFPVITIPINVLVWGIGIAPVVKEYLDRLKK